MYILKNHLHLKINLYSLFYSIFIEKSFNQNILRYFLFIFHLVFIEKPF